MGDALLIEKTAQCGLAEEYDAAQERGDENPGGDRNSMFPTRTISGLQMSASRANKSTKRVLSATRKRSIRASSEKHRRQIKDRKGADASGYQARYSACPCSAPAQTHEPDNRSPLAPKPTPSQKALKERASCARQKSRRRRLELRRQENNSHCGWLAAKAWTSFGSTYRHSPRATVSFLSKSAALSFLVTRAIPRCP